MSERRRRPENRDGIDRAAVRHLLQGVLCTDADLESFCIDEFESVQRTFSDGMNREAKHNLLLKKVKAGTIYEALRRKYPEEVAALEHETERGGGSTGSVATGATDPRDRVIELSSSLDWNRRALLGAYFYSAQGVRRREFDGDTSADLAVRMLRALFPVLRQSDGTLPWLTFVWHLVRIASAPCTRSELNRITVPLSDCFDDAARPLGLDPSRIEAWKQRVADDHERLGQLDLHVLIIVSPRVLDRPPYLVRAFRVLAPIGTAIWTDEDVAPIEIQGNDDGEIQGAGELPTLVKGILRGLDACIGRASGAPTVELFVPIQLLGCDVDQWFVDAGLDESPLGHEYNVVVRSWDRAYGQHHGKLLQKWRPLWTRLFPSTASVVWHCGPEHVSKRGNELQLPPEHPPCIVMSFAPLADLQDGTSRALRQIVNGGSPVAVWPRRIPQSTDERWCFLSALSSGKPVETWREEVRWFRRTTVGTNDPEHPGSHLTLLWDDPNKLPPDAPCRNNVLIAPARTKESEA